MESLREERFALLIFAEFAFPNLPPIRKNNFFFFFLVPHKNRSHGIFIKSCLIFKFERSFTDL